MKGLSVQQPYANLVIYGHRGAFKSIETRTWATRYRGDLVICASREPMPGCFEKWDGPVEYGKAIGVVELVDCRRMVRADAAAAMCAYRDDLFAWALANPRPVKPVAVRGQLRLFNLPVGMVLEYV